jgi:hypothetical protein
MKRGIIQSRGLGDILIALPIARHYYDEGDEIVWPVCKEFIPSLAAIDWIQWVGIDTDAQGKFFIETPLLVFKEYGVDPNTSLYLYHYLNSQPQMTDPEMFNILKFDQYKYQVAGVPFMKKWTLSNCIVRDLAREKAFKESLSLPERYALVHLNGSSHRAELDTSWIDPAVKVIEITELSDNIFDWLTAIEDAEIVVCVDSVFSNMIDQLCIDGPDLYWIRRSPWDLTPVLGNSWTLVPSKVPIGEPKRVDPAAEAKALMQRIADARVAAERAATKAKNESSVVSHVPFQAKGSMPTSFMSALKPAAPKAVTNPAAMLNDMGKVPKF